MFAQLRKHDKSWRVEEAAYRQSRLCRLLGNPVAFANVQALAETKEMRPGAVADALGRRPSSVSHVLAALRLAEKGGRDTGSNIRGRSGRFFGPYQNSSTRLTFAFGLPCLRDAQKTPPRQLGRKVPGALCAAWKT
jgi:hypothetical protein